MLSFQWRLTPPADVGDQPPSPPLPFPPFPFPPLAPSLPFPLPSLSAPFLSPLPSLPLPLLSLPGGPFPLIAAREPGGAQHRALKLPSRSGLGPAARRIQVYFRLKMSHLLTAIGKGYRIRQL